ncbi:hypothetical protein ACLK1Y_11210 [Escherichia coli]
MYSEKSLTWNGITQQNRNGLLSGKIDAHRWFENRSHFRRGL